MRSFRCACSGGTLIDTVAVDALCCVGVVGSVAEEEEESSQDDYTIDGESVVQPYPTLVASPCLS